MIKSCFFALHVFWFGCFLTPASQRLDTKPPVRDHPASCQPSGRAPGVLRAVLRLSTPLVTPRGSQGRRRGPERGFGPWFPGAPPVPSCGPGCARRLRPRPVGGSGAGPAPAPGGSGAPAPAEGVWGPGGDTGGGGCGVGC